MLGDQIHTDDCNGQRSNTYAHPSFIYDQIVRIVATLGATHRQSLRLSRRELAKIPTNNTAN